ncbi:putative transposase [Lyngbya sp. PCC 8106]|nr:putative transposase [Lyngbya sp. PCC 8106]
MKLVNCSISVAIPWTYGALRKAETGDYQALPNQPKGSNHKITNWEKFREFAVVHGDKTQVEMAQLWEEKISDCRSCGTGGANRTISRALKKIGFTRKKRLMVTEKEMKLNDKNF